MAKKLSEKMGIVSDIMQILDFVGIRWALFSLIAMPTLTATVGVVQKIPAAAAISYTMVAFFAGLGIVAVCAHIKERPKEFVGQIFEYEGIGWKPETRNRGKDNASIVVGDPRCIKCHAPLMWDSDDFAIPGPSGYCPMPNCKRRTYEADSLYTVQEAARKCAVGMSEHGEIEWQRKS